MQDVCVVGLPPSRVRKLSSHDFSVENKKRKYSRKRKLDQQLDGGQKRICFRISNAGHDIDVPGPPSEVLEPGALLSAGSEREGQQQGAGCEARAAPAEPLSGAFGRAI